MMDVGITPNSKNSFKNIYNYQKNSFTFIRLLLSILVILGHSYELGPWGDDPLQKLFGIKIGAFAVDCFFAMSGFLVTQSFFSTPSKLIYLWKRCLRIFPGFWVCLFLIGLILCPIMYYVEHHTLGRLFYIVNNPFLEYVFKNFMLKMQSPYIKGLFEHGYSRTIDGSLWTLYPEFFCYLSLILLNIFFLIKKRPGLVLAFFVMIIIISVSKNFILPQISSKFIYNRIWYFFIVERLYAFFLAGSLIFLYSDRILWKPILVVIMVFLLLLSMKFGFYLWLGPIFLSYLLIGIAITSPYYHIDHYGDYSYGIYIYSYPIQQSILALNLNILSVFLFFILSVIISFIFAWFSWHLVEKKFLELKKVKPLNLLRNFFWIKNDQSP